MVIFGTAGHIDHGKTTLIHSLTGIDADRLPEEKKRGMTIDIGFAWMQTSKGEKIGIIDVPGHENFIRNMIIGMTSVDAFILVVDAKEGWKPQTEEHFRIIRLLDIHYGLIVITKADLVSNDRMKQVRKEIQEKISPISSPQIPIFSFSKEETRSIDQIRQEMEKVNQMIPAKRDIGKPRLFIDRVFDIKGSGTVVTGTLINGNLYQNQYVNLFPLDRKVRLRQLQSYGLPVAEAIIGSRVALNLSGVKKEELNRGDLVYGRQKYQYGKMIDVKILLPAQKDPSVLKNGNEVDFISHTKILRGRIIFKKGNLRSGEQSYAQIRFKEALCLMQGDYFIVRLPGVNETLGGGRILDSLAKKHSFYHGMWDTWLEKRKNIDIQELILTDLQKIQVIKREGLLTNSPYSEDEIRQQTEDLSEKNRLFLIRDWVIDAQFWSKQTNQAIDYLEQMHRDYPLKVAFPLIELKNNLPFLSADLFQTLLDYLVGKEKIRVENGEVSAFNHKLVLSEAHRNIVKNILQYINKDPEHLPTKKELDERFLKSQSLIGYLVKNGEIIVLEEQILITPVIYQKIKNKIIDYLKKNQTISIGEVRDLLHISRKYIIPLLTKMDEEGITLRRENKRVLRNP